MASLHYGIISTQWAISDITDLQVRAKDQLNHSSLQNMINKGQQEQIQLDDKYVKRHFLPNDQHGLKDILEYTTSSDHVQSPACGWNSLPSLGDDLEQLA